jgi:LysM repeat protein
LVPRERIAAAGFGGGATIFATENMACATSATIDWLQNKAWADDVHMYPMVKPEYTHIGAGAYTASSGITYYVVHAAYVAGGSSSYTSSSSSRNSLPTATTDLSNFVQPVLTATPNEDGDTYHIVKYGQALSTIATWYGVTVEQLKLLNALTSDAIYEGQKLLISIKPTVTVTPTRTATVPIPTRTPTLTQVPPTARATVTATPTPKPSLGNFVGHIDRQYLGFGILLASAVGFLIVLLSSFLKPIRKK